MKSHFSRCAFMGVLVAEAFVGGCTSSSASGREGSATQPARAPFAAVYPDEAGYGVVALVLERVNPKETPRYAQHPSIGALDQAFARHRPGRVSVESADPVDALVRRVQMCEASRFQGPCSETVYAAHLARRRSAAIEVRVPGSLFARHLPPRGAGGQTGVVMVVLAPDAFEREKSPLAKRLGEPRFFLPLRSP